VDKALKNILVVDDDRHLLELLIDTLTAIGYESMGVSDGLEALECLKTHKFDLVISDIRMPGLDGIGLLRKIRRYYSDLPVLFITGVDMPEVIGKASPDGLLAKPFRISHIEEMINDALSGKDEVVANAIRKVLVVDDDDTFREMLSDALRYNDYIPFAAAGGKEALRELENGSVDAVITDIRMPGMDGIELLKTIKDQYPDLPVILITAFFDRDDLESSLGDQEADGFLEKPFRVEKVMELLERISPVARPSSH